MTPRLLDKWEYPLLFEPPRLLIFMKISSLPIFSPKQMQNFPPYPLLLFPTRLLILKKIPAYPFIRASPYIRNQYQFLTLCPRGHQEVAESLKFYKFD